ncbi:MAG: DUF1648 domain-containing protein [Blastocatellia bacterium]|nr:DUF1648 domain-containing protein [Blastocatellia bacterium]
MLVLINSLSVVVLLVGWWIAVSVYPRLPDRIPIHFGLSGEADGWGGRAMIFLLPAVQVGMALLFFFVFQHEHRATRPLSEAARLPLRMLTLEMQVMFTWLTWRISENAFGRAQGLSVWFLPVILLVLGATSAWMVVAGRG